MSVDWRQSNGRTGGKRLGASGRAVAAGRYAVGLAVPGMPVRSPARKVPDHVVSSYRSIKKGSS